MSEFIRPLFPLGEVKIVEPATVVMARAGQDADFFLQMHACGIWSDQDADRNQQSLKTGSMILNRYHTLLGDKITVVTLSNRCQTGVVCDRFEDSTALYDPGCHDDRNTCAEVTDGGYALLDSDSTTRAPAEGANFSGLGSLETMALYQTTDPSHASAADYADDSPMCHFPIETNSICSPSDEDEPKPKGGDYTLTEKGFSGQFDYSGHDPFESIGYVPNMTYDCGERSSIDSSSTAGSADTPPDEARQL